MYYFGLELWPHGIFIWIHSARKYSKEVELVNLFHPHLDQGSLSPVPQQLARDSTMPVSPACSESQVSGILTNTYRAKSVSVGKGGHDWKEPKSSSPPTPYNSPAGWMPRIFYNSRA